MHLTGVIRVDLWNSGARCVDLFSYRLGRMSRFSGESLFERVVRLHDAQAASASDIRKAIECSGTRADRESRPTGENPISGEKNRGSGVGSEASTERES